MKPVLLTRNPNSCANAIKLVDSLDPQIVLHIQPSGLEGEEGGGLQPTSWTRN
jgi:hypothetical protein